MQTVMFHAHKTNNKMPYENYDPCFPDQPVVDLYLPMWANLPSFRSKPAFVWVEDKSQTETVLTYSQLNTSANSIASHLLKTLERRDTILILCPPGLQLAQTLFGCQRAGLLSVPISPPDPSFTKQNYHHLFRVLSQTKPKAAIADPDYITKVQSHLSSPSSDKHLCHLLSNTKWISFNSIDIDSSSLASSSSSSSSSYIGCMPSEVYLIQYTSGATGIPKPVLVCTGAATHNVRVARKAYDLDPNSVIVSWLPQYHDCGLMFLLLTIVSGATCVLTSPIAFVQRPRLWLEMITKYKAHCTPVPSFALPLVVRRGGINQGALPISLWSLRNLIIINEPIYKASIDEFVQEFVPMGLDASCISPSYGLAENCTFVSTAWRKPTEATCFPNIPSFNKLLPSARLASIDSEEQENEHEMNIIIVNEDTCEMVDDGVEGEIWVSSPSNAIGYLGYPSLTQEVFQGRVRDMVYQNFVRTGDRGVIRGKERYLYVMGRCLDVLKIGEDCREVHPHVIESAAYNTSPKLLRGGCIAAFDILKTIVVVAELQSSESDITVLRRVCEGIREGVSKEENVRVGLVVLAKSGSVPKTTSGKVQRWLAKDKLMRGEMRIISEVNFGDGRDSSTVQDGKRNRMEEDGHIGSISREIDEVFLFSASSNSSIRSPLMSFL